MDNQNVENQNTELQGQQDNENSQEKMFTQDELNRIIGERLSRAKANTSEVVYTERENTLNQRELQLDAREKLYDAGLPKELLPLVNCNSKEDMQKSIDLISSYFKQSGVAASAPVSAMTGYRVSTGASSGSSANTEMSDSEIRAVMGLKG